MQVIDKFIIKMQVIDKFHIIDIFIRNVRHREIYYKQRKSSINLS